MSSDIIERADGYIKHISGLDKKEFKQYAAEDFKYYALYSLVMKELELLKELTEYAKDLEPSPIKFSDMKEGESYRKIVTFKVERPLIDTSDLEEF